MSIGNWDPGTQQANDTFQLDPQILRRFIGLTSDQQLEQLATELSAQELQTHAALMQTEKEQWLALGDDFSDQDIENLMRFFTVAEKLPGWDAGSKSPVIWLGKILKQRRVGINRELVLWIKANSDNQYLPHGPL